MAFCLLKVSSFQSYLIIAANASGHRFRDGETLKITEDRQFNCALSFKQFCCFFLQERWLQSGHNVNSSKEIIVDNCICRKKSYDIGN